MAKILLVEDDHSVSEAVTMWLQENHHQVEAVFDGKEALDFLLTYAYDVIVLDWDLPSMAGIEVCKSYRGKGGATPIIMLTGRSAIEAKEEGLDSGADDYLSKPFHPKELLARVRALTRRSVAVTPTQLKVADLELDGKQHQAVRGDKHIDLSPKEYQLLEFFLRHPQTVFSADALIERVWTSDSDTTALSVRVYINKLRQKLDRPGESSVIENVKGHGYKLNL